MRCLILLNRKFIPVIIIAEALQSPCCMTSSSYFPICQQNIESVTDSGWILILCYPSVRSSGLLNGLDPSKSMISFILGIGILSLSVTRFLGVQSCTNLASCSLSAFGCVNMPIGLLDLEGTTLPVSSSVLIFSDI